jgi:hypothetical protein
MVAEFSDAAFAMKKGDISQAARSQLLSRHRATAGLGVPLVG